MSGFLALGLIAGGLIAVALVILAMDVARGDIGGRHTMERARRLLVITLGAETIPGANEWIERHRVERPDMQVFVMDAEESQESFLAVQDGVERTRPDAIVVVRPDSVSRGSLEGLYGRLKEDSDVPVDSVYVKAGATA